MKRTQIINKNWGEVVHGGRQFCGGIFLKNNFENYPIDNINLICFEIFFYFSYLKHNVSFWVAATDKISIMHRMSPSASTTPYYRERLREELTTRISKNPRYSLRSFASALGIHSGALSQILAGKRSMSTKLMERVFANLEFSPSEQKLFLESLLNAKQCLKRVSPKLKSKLQKLPVPSADLQPEIRDLGLDQFRVIADWYHAAILELTRAKHFNSDPRSIAKALGISVIEAKLAIDRLLRLELIEETDGSLSKVDLRLDTKDKTKTSSFHRKRMEQVLNKSIHSLQNDPIDERNHSGMTLCVNPEQLPEAKQRIQKFLWELGELLTQGKQERVYELHVSLFPVQIKNQNQGETK